MNIFKKLFIPSGEKTTVIAYNSWIVRWQSVRFTNYGSNYAEITHESEIFPSEIDANKFAESLKEARILLKDKCSFLDNYTIKIEANQNKLSTQTA